MASSPTMSPWSGGGGGGSDKVVPSAPLLYVLIEIFALQLRKNWYIVGFKVGIGKIVSAHYTDAVITIKQNSYFKEVLKDLTR